MGVVLVNIVCVNDPHKKNAFHTFSTHPCFDCLFCRYYSFSTTDQHIFLTHNFNLKKKILTNLKTFKNIDPTVSTDTIFNLRYALNFECSYEFDFILVFIVFFLRKQVQYAKNWIYFPVVVVFLSRNSIEKKNHKFIGDSALTILRLFEWKKWF